RHVRGPLAGPRARPPAVAGPLARREAAGMGLRRAVGRGGRGAAGPSAAVARRHARVQHEGLARTARPPRAPVPESRALAARSPGSTVLAAPEAATRARAYG